MAYARRNSLKTHKGRPLAIAIGMALVVALIFASSLGLSAIRAKDLLDSARVSYASVKTEIDAGNFSTALKDARSALNDISALDEELRGLQWDIAAALPYVGTDAKMAREIASIAGDLANESLLPILDEWDGFANASEDDSGLNGLVNRLTSTAKTLSHSADVLYQCKNRANALPKSHVSQLNDLADELKDLLSTATDVLDALGGTAGVTNLSSILGSATK